MVRYKVKQSRVDENLALVRDVYDELHRVKPDGLRYATFRLDDGVSFVHLAITDQAPGPLPQIEAFKCFQADITDRCDEPPVVTEVSEVGSYRLAADDG
jgi:hypothetical protein